MKAGLIGAVAIGGAVVLALGWTFFAGTDPGPTADRPAGTLTDPAVEIAGSAPTPALRPGADGTAAPAPSTGAEGGADRLAAAAPGAATPAPPDRSRANRRDVPEAPADGAPATAARADGALGTAASTDGTPAGTRGAPLDDAQSSATAADLVAPSFDIVRIDADGQTVIAGRTAPNEEVDILLDGRVVETMLADAGGRFVAVLSSGVSPDARELRLRVSRPEPPAGQAPASPASPDGQPALPEQQAERGGAGASPRMASPTAPADARAEGDGSRPVGLSPVRAGDAAAGDGTSPASAPLPEPPSAPGQAAGAATRSAPGIAGATAPPGGAAGERHLLSDAVIILPAERAGGAPALVRVEDERLALLQPGGAEADGVVLDQLTQHPGGDLLLRGRARPGHAVRIYGNGRAIDTVPVADGGWSLTVPDTRAGDIRLFRLDEIARSGAVASRVEVPFQPSDAGSQIVRDRSITVRRGDNLWRIAEQHYGDGIRYSLIFGANGDLIRDPDLIYPDQVFTVPELVEAE